MGKKKNKTLDEPELTIDIKSMYHENALFFDKLVDLIPARFYLPDEKDKPWFQGLSKAEKASAKKQSRENVKKARRDRLDPEKSTKSTLRLLKENLEKDKNKDSDGEEEEIEVRPIMSDLDGGEERSVTYEELRERLRRKIEELRGGRNTAGSDKGKKRKNERNDKKGNVQKKQKRYDGGAEEKKVDASNDEEKVGKDVEEAAKELTFSRVKLGDDDNHGKRKKRKLSKFKELENARRLEEAKNDPEKGEVVAKKHSWKAAMDRAAGIKVHDDPKLLRQSIQKEKKRHQKNAEKWNERVETTEKLKAEKQQKRSENIADKIHQKKMRRIAKREKKLLRPGFEGRKEGFINGESA
ncbi:ribosomal RNA-processing protein 14-like [Hibiscus syriacus]|nr:ribosomal RNA-processing protein 14-like [Hibiscus syriacus]